MFNSKIGIGVLKHPGYNKGKGGSSSSSTATDFFGVGARAPYADLLNALLLGGNVGATPGHYEGATAPTYGGGGTSLIGYPMPSYMISPGSPGTYVPGTGGMSIGDFLKQTPGYQFGITQGQEAINRTFAARGFGHSGNEDLALQNYGNQYAGQYLQQLISNLAAPSGASLIGNNSQSQSSPGFGGVFGTIAGLGLSMMNPAAGAGGLLGTAPSAGGLSISNSDRNLKTNIKHINTINGIKIYSFNYIWSYLKSVGVMAQDLLKMPQYKHVVGMNSLGYTVDYSKLPI